MSRHRLQVKRGHVACRGAAGFTLTELLVAMALGLIVLGVVGYAYFNTSRAIQRSMAMVRLHQQAAAVMQRMEAEVMASAPGGVSCAGNILDVIVCLPGSAPDSKFALRKTKWQITATTPPKLLCNYGTVASSTNLTDATAAVTPAPGDASLATTDVVLDRLSAAGNTIVKDGDYIKVILSLTTAGEDPLTQKFEHWIPIPKSTIP